MPFLTYDPLPQCLQQSPLTPLLLARGHQRGSRRYLSDVKCLQEVVWRQVTSERLCFSERRYRTTIYKRSTVIIFFTSNEAAFIDANFFANKPPSAPAD